MLDFLSEKTFLLYAAKNYDNPNCFSEEEFFEDLNRFKYLKKLFTKYLESGDIKERLVLNHIIALYNVFGIVPTCRMLFLKLRGYEKELKPFLILLQIIPDKLDGIENQKNILTSDIPMDKKIVELLRKI
jgi:hypothetical protein